MEQTSDDSKVEVVEYDSDQWEFVDSVKYIWDRSRVT